MKPLAHQQLASHVNDLIDGDIRRDRAALLVASRLELCKVLLATNFEWQRRVVRSVVGVVMLVD